MAVSQRCQVAAKIVSPDAADIVDSTEKATKLNNPTFHMGDVTLTDAAGTCVQFVPVKRLFQIQLMLILASFSLPSYSMAFYEASVIPRDSSMGFFVSGSMEAPIPFSRKDDRLP